MALAFGRSSRNSSPYRAYRPSSLNGSLPGLSPSMTVSSSSISRKRSITPTRPGARSSSPVPPGSQQRNKPMLSPAIYSPRDRPPRYKENVSVTVRFRPLSQREIQKGDEVAWYADGDSIVRNEYSPSTMYAFDKVFGPATTTRGVYDVAAKHVVQGAMEGLNGTVFAYGVTSSGKTHTMHGDQKSPGIIPLAIKDVFSIIQDTPGREFLLRVSYLEIYNEVINDLLDPIGQNLRIREDCQGTYVEGLKEEVILSPAHALSLIAAGEEHRHVGSNNFNLFSSRSHTIFTLTVESSSRAENDNDEVALSQLNLIDLAGSESSKTETTGLRRKEGSYINKSLLTLGTVISKLSDGKASHVPYRDSKLTRLLQSSLSGHGRVSLICTITPASSNAEETHNTLKFAHRAKRIEIHAAPNRILDEKSLIKKYQKEIAILKAELDQVRRGVVDSSLPFGTSEEDLIALRQQLEAGQVKMQSRLEEEEQAKAALMGRIQRLTKLILVSTKTTIPKIISETPTHRRRHSFGEEELSYLPERANLLGLTDDEDSGSVVNDIEASVDSKGGISSIDDLNKDDKKTKRRSVLGWFKLKKNESLSGGSALSFDTDNSPTASTASAASNGAQFDSALECKGGRWKSSAGRRVSESTPAVDSFPESTMAGELFSATTRGRRPPPTGETMMDQMDLLREQSKMLAGEMALCTSSFKRLSEQVAVNPDDLQFQAQLRKMKDEIQEKKRQIRILEQRIIGVGEAALNNASPLEMSQTVSKLMSQLNEKEFELEIKTADNRILQEQLQEKIAENKDLQATIAVYKQQQGSCKGRNSGEPQHSGGETSADNESLSSKASSKSCLPDSSLQCQILTQAAEIEMLKQERVRLIEEKEGLNIQSQKLAEEASYAKELASAAAVELKNLAEEVTKLSFQNTKLSNDLATTREFMFNRAAMRPIAGKGLLKPRNRNEGHANADHFKLGRNDKPLASRLSDTGNDLHDDINSWKLDPDDLKRELYARKEKEAGLEATLAEKELVESDLRKKLEEAKKREADLESDLAGMWVLVAQLKKEQGSANELARIDSNDSSQNNSSEKNNENYNRFQGHGLETKDCREQEKAAEDVRAALEECHRKVAEQEGLISQLKGEQLDDLNLSALEDLQKLHVEALTKLCQAKARAQERCLKEQEVSMDHQDDERGSHICKVCFEAPTAAVLLPCRHFCLCKPCAIACTECPLCRSGIADRIITYTS